MARFDDWVTDPTVRWSDVSAFVAEPGRSAELYLGRYLVWQTSGTSGVPVVLLQDRATRAVSGALDLTRGLPTWLSWRDVATFVWRGRRAAAILARDGHWATWVALQHAIRRQPWRRGRTRVLSVLAPLAEQVRELNAFQPSLLGGYATALTRLAYEQEAGRLRLRPILIISGAETLTPAMRSRLETSFGCPVREAYGAGEAYLAFDCCHGWFHVNADWVIVEPVDENNAPTPPGRFSHSVLVTNLANRVQPIIRYNLADRVLLRPDPCPCGNALPAIRVEGRTDEILTFSTRDGARVHLAPLSLYLASWIDGVRRSQVIQVAPSRLRVRFEPVRPEEDGVLWARLQRQLQAFLAEQGCEMVTVERAPEAPAPESRGGKFRHVWSELHRPVSPAHSTARAAPCPVDRATEEWISEGE
jgi:phenylacetate-coenzyme A ligase PaaK-like adenylate-forming protein